MPKIDTLEYFLKKKMVPLGIDKNQNTIGVEMDELVGINLLFGVPGNGKSMTLENIIITNLYNNRGGLFIDPYGDVIKDLLQYLPQGQEEKVIIFEATESTLDGNIQKFSKQIDMGKIEDDEEIFLLLNLDYRIIGHDTSRDLGIYILKEFLKRTDGKNRSIFIDEADNFIDYELHETILQSKNKNLVTFLVNQNVMRYRRDIIENFLKNADNLFIYNIEKASAGLIHIFHNELDEKELSQILKFHSIAKLNINSDEPKIIKIQNIFPLPYPKK